MRWSAACLLLIAPLSRPVSAEPPAFRMQEIDANVGEVCYALAAADIDGNGTTDIVAATEDTIVWYSNPTWTRATILKGATKPDNVCIKAGDVDGDGRMDLMVGSGWGPLGLRGTEELVLLTRPKGSTRWEVVHVAPVPSLHRLAFGAFAGGERQGRELVTVPLQGRGVKEPNWGAGPGVAIRSFRVPPDPSRDRWTSELVDEGLHTAHGVHAVDVDGDGRDELLIAAWEGVFQIRRGGDGRWARVKIGDGYQLDGPSKGAGEVRLGRLAGGRHYVATVEPWHGFQVVAYRPPASGSGPWERRLIDGDVAGSHALWCADFNGDGSDEIAVAQRDPNHDLKEPPDGSRILVYRLKDDSTFEKQIVDDGGIAAEDLLGADLDADGRIDLVAGGRETHNVRIYWNRARPARSR